MNKVLKIPLIALVTTIGIIVIGTWLSGFFVCIFLALGGHGWWALIILSSLTFIGMMVALLINEDRLRK